MRHVKNVVATVGKYIDKTGQEKNRYMTCGRMMERDDGSNAIVIDSMPVGGSEWNGWFNLYEPSERDAQGGGAPTQRASAPTQDLDDEIPF